MTVVPNLPRHSENSLNPICKCDDFAYSSFRLIEVQLPFRLCGQVRNIHASEFGVIRQAG